MVAFALSLPNEAKGFALLPVAATLKSVTFDVMVTKAFKPSFSVSRVAAYCVLKGH